MYLLCAVCVQTREFCRNTKVHTRHKFVKTQYVFSGEKMPQPRDRWTTEREEINVKARSYV